ncbi:TetR/AcrR family transcriptional regulator [Undibacterium sp. CY18W]|uniref:TetR/AcrR family transcriptional regulator n=1 Tax=Undibacterium hunanense TaxID=2762292 RepID=A0ABR6ZYY5_9BURK|nr:TetR/AcrR family transcriptional regulator [Undibacterium hunanense]MBC3921049.1 TetR/AcrR family transcriptional regulator [Undibacterium hunanense]
MKTSKSQQEQTRRNLIRTAVDLITEKGYDATTMKQIARDAGIGDATIYKYFPSKEKILLAYYELCIDITIEVVQETPGWEEFTLQEKLQRLVDALLELLLGDREFVEITRDIFGKSPLLMMRDNMPGQQTLKQEIISLLEEAEQRGDISPCDFKNLIGGLFGDYLFAVIAYWLKDESEEFSNTTQLVDMTLAILVMALKSGIVNKVTELASFMLRNQLSRIMQNGSGLLEMVKLVQNGLGRGLGDAR